MAFIADAPDLNASTVSVVAFVPSSNIICVDKHKQNEGEHEITKYRSHSDLSRQKISIKQDHPTTDTDEVEGKNRSDKTSI